MPIYEYECKKCGNIAEVLQKISDPAPKKCEECGSKRVQKVMSRTSFVLKGEGWYVTDYARKGKKGDDAGGESGSSSDKSSTSDKSSNDKKKTKNKGGSGSKGGGAKGTKASAA